MSSGKEESLDHWSWFKGFFGSPEPIEDVGKSLGDGATLIAHDPHINTEPVIAFTAVVVLLFVCAFIVYGKTKDTEAGVMPESKFSVRTFFELMIGSVYDMMVDMMGRKAAAFFLPLIGTCAVVIFFSNVLSLIPGFLPPTSNMNMTLMMGLIVFLSTHIFGIKEQGLTHYVMHFMGPTFKVGGLNIPFLAPLIMPIELVSHLVRPLTLALRLAANMFADHAVIGAFLALGVAMSFYPLALPFYFLGCVVVTVQTLVFCLLSIVYIAMAIAHEEEH